MIHETSIIHPNVILGNNVVVEEFCILGVPPRGFGPGDLQTIIESNSIIRAGTIIYAGNKIGKGFQTGNKVNIRESNEIGENVSIGTLTVIEHHISIEDGVRIHSQAFIPEYTKLHRECWIGPCCVLTNAKFPQSPDAKSHLTGPIISQKAKLGANCTVLPGVTIGENALVGAGSVVTKDLPPNVIAAGNPAKIIRNIDY